LGDNPKFVLSLGANFVRDTFRVPARQTNLNFFDKPRLFALPCRNVCTRHEICTFIEFDIAPLSDQERVVACLRELTPEIAHLRGRLQVEVSGIESESLGVIKRCSGSNTQEYVMGICIGFMYIMQVVCRHQGQFECFSDLDQIWHEIALDR